MASEYYKWLARDVKPEQERVLTKAEQRRNWWYYYKYYVLTGVILAGIGISLLCSWLGVGQIKPDYRIAYAGTVSLSEEAAEAIEAAFARLGKDENGDGKVTIQVNQYVSHSTGDSDSLYYAEAAAAKLIGDITDCDSYFFLLEDPEGFQRSMHVLCNADGSLPKDTELSAEGRAWPITDFAALADLPEECSGLYLGRRGFWTEDTVNYLEGCEALWNSLRAE